jgi:hypothetical protein
MKLGRDLAVAVTTISQFGHCFGRFPGGGVAALEGAAGRCV